MVFLKSAYLPKVCRYLGMQCGAASIQVRLSVAVTCNGLICRSHLPRRLVILVIWWHDAGISSFKLVLDPTQIRCLSLSLLHICLRIDFS